MSAMVAVLLVLGRGLAARSGTAVERLLLRGEVRKFAATRGGVMLDGNQAE
jgi:hypothetical protein